MTFFLLFIGKTVKSQNVCCYCFSIIQPVLVYVLQLCVQWPLILSPVRQDVSHRATGLVKTQVEAVGMNLRTVCDFKH